MCDRPKTPNKTQAQLLCTPPATADCRHNTHETTLETKLSLHVKRHTLLQAYPPPTCMCEQSPSTGGCWVYAKNKRLPSPRQTVVCKSASASCMHEHANATLLGRQVRVRPCVAVDNNGDAPQPVTCVNDAAIHTALSCGGTRAHPPSSAWACAVAAAAPAAAAVAVTAAAALTAA